MMQPYYSSENVDLYLGDWADVMPYLPINSVDLLLTDPPFFMPASHYQSRKNWQKKWADSSILKEFFRSFLRSAIPKIKESGHFMTFCNHDSYAVFYPEIYSNFDKSKCLVWNKEIVGLGRVWRNQHELIISARWKTSMFWNDGKLRADVLSHRATKTKDRDHPVQKPVSLLCDLIEPTTDKGCVVLDPFAGSGSTLIGALLLSRKAVGIEMDESYCEKIAKSIEELKK